MIRIAVIGQIGSGKSHIAKLLGIQFLTLIKKLLKYI